MTTFGRAEVLCGVCGAKAQQLFVTSTMQRDPPDLDGRPGEMMRSTMSRWITQCPSCGAIAGDLSKLSWSITPVVQSAKYRAVLSDEQKPALARAFECAAILAQAARDPAQAYRWLVCAGWAADDAKAPSIAADYRRQAIAAAPAPESEQEAIAQLDVCRRAGLFEEAVRRASELSERSTKVARRIAEFQRARAMLEDVDVHQAADALATPVNLSELLPSLLPRLINSAGRAVELAVTPREQPYLVYADVELGEALVSLFTDLKLELDPNARIVLELYQRLSWVMISVEVVDGPRLEKPPRSFVEPNKDRGGEEIFAVVGRAGGKVILGWSLTGSVHLQFNPLELGIR